MILNAAVTFSFDGAAANVEEVGREFAVQLDDVHRRHGEAGAVDHAADVAVELDIGEVILAGFDFGRVFLGLVAQLGQILVAEQRVRIEAHLGVEHQQLVAIAFAASGLISICRHRCRGTRHKVRRALCACLARSPVSLSAKATRGRGAA